MISLNRHSKDGFTLIEILIAIALVLILGAIAKVSYDGIMARSRRQATIASMRSIKEAMNRYQEDMDELPESLRDLVKKPSGEKAENWQGPYMETKNNETPKDAWKHEFHYARTPEADHPYVLESYGAKGKGSKDGRIDVWKQ